MDEHFRDSLLWHQILFTTHAGVKNVGKIKVQGKTFQWSVYKHPGNTDCRQRSEILRMTLILAEDAASPPGLLARHVYRALWWRIMRRIFKQHVPLILVRTNSGDVSMLWSSLNHDIVGDGMPVTWHSMENGEFSNTSTDFRFRVKSGGIICWWVSENEMLRNTSYTFVVNPS